MILVMHVIDGSYDFERCRELKPEFGRLLFNSSHSRFFRHIVLRIQFEILKGMLKPTQPVLFLHADTLDCAYQQTAVCILSLFAKRASIEHDY